MIVSRPTSFPESIENDITNSKNLKFIYSKKIELLFVFKFSFISNTDGRTKEKFIM